MSFSEIVGFEAARRLFTNQLSQGQIPHTYLFVGPKGIGKRSLALQMAKSLECESPQGGQACDACLFCRQVEEGTFPDLIQISPESETRQIKIDAIRRLTDSMALTPFQGRWKVGIIEQAHRMTEEALHACLKLLEEPPGRSVLILTAEALHRLPATLVSRCHLVRCAPQGVGQVAQFLQTHEKVEKSLAAMLAVSAGGRLGLALDLSRNGRWKEKNDLLNELLEAHRQNLVEIPLGKASRLEIEEALGWWMAWWRDLLLLRLGADPAWVIHQDRLPELAQSASSMSVETLLQRIERAYWVQGAIEQNASPRIALAVLLSHHV